MKDIVPRLQNTFSLSHEASHRLAEILTPSPIEKGNTFVKKGKTNKKEYLLFEGICRSFVVNPSGEEITLSFFTSDSAISPNLTRTKSDLSILNIQALTDLQLFSFLSEDLMLLMNAHREIELWANAILQAELMQKVNKEITQNSMTATMRLIHFRESYPSLENHIPHSFIASYLGITTVSLSRIRKELTTK